MDEPRSLRFARIRAICMAFPQATEKPAWGTPTWRVGDGAMFAQPTGDGDLTLPAAHAEQAALVEADPSRFFVPAYVGVKGWVGVRLDGGPDWEQVAALVAGAYRRVAPRRLHGALDDPALEPRVLARAAREAAANAGEEAEESRRAVAAASALERLRDISLGWPAVAERPGTHTAFQAAGKTFAWLMVDHHGDGMVSVSCKADPGVQDLLVRGDPARYFVPSYMSAHGWVGVRVDIDAVDWDEVRALVLGSYRLIAPKRAIRELDAAKGS